MNVLFKIALIALLCINSASAAFAENSRVEGNVQASVTGALVTNIAAGVGTEAMTGSIYLESSELYGNVTTEVEGLMTIMNTAIGINAFADMGSVILKNAIVRGDINISVKGLSLINMAIGNDTRAGLGSVVAR